MVQRTPQVHRRKANRARSSGATPVKRYGLIAFFTTFLFVMTPPGIIVNLGDGLGTEVSWYLRYGAIAVALLCYIAKGCRKAFYVLALAYGILSFGTMFLGDAPLFGPLGWLSPARQLSYWWGPLEEIATKSSCGGC